MMSKGKSTAVQSNQLRILQKLALWMAFWLQKDGQLRRSPLLEDYIESTAPSFPGNHLVLYYIPFA